MPTELLLVVVVLAVLGLGLRLSFGTGARARKREYGLLRPVAVAPSERAAEAVVTRLRAHGIRVTTASTEDATFRVLVFPSDEQRAIAVLLEENWPGDET